MVYISNILRVLSKIIFYLLQDGCMFRFFCGIHTYGGQRGNQLILAQRMEPHLGVPDS